ncbi:MAG: cation transporter [Clostridiales bacterium]|nr:cation transporter [Clostridiales bacterium]
MTETKNRTKSALVILAVGLALNIALGIAKLAVGILANSSAVSSDALNNISDSAVSIVTIIATALAARAADHDHPFGHGRYEYIATFILGAVIVAVGAEAFIGGVKRAVQPEQVAFDIAVWVILGVSIGVKCFMFGFYSVHGRRVKSDTIKAAAVDSASDAAVTSLVLVCAVIERMTGAHIDGYASIAVAIVIVVFGVRILKSTVSRLLGERPDAELYDLVMNILTSDSRVMSVHDLIINDYGAAKKIAEADAVFPSGMAFVEVHAVCDALERKVLEATGVRLCIHADPYVEGDERLDGIRSGVDSVIGVFGATAHDISIDDECRKVTLDIKLPDDKVPSNEIKAQIEAIIHTVVPQYAVEICIDYI